MTTQTRRWPVLDPKGVERKENKDGEIWAGYKFLCQVGDLDLLFRTFGHLSYAVVCAPWLRKQKCWNVTCFDIADGAITFGDNDVSPDPYHMCLLHQKLEELT